MTTIELRNQIVKGALTREKKNKYSQDGNKRLLIESGYGDCSATVRHWYLKYAKIDIGINTEAQITNKSGKVVSLAITDGVPDESKMLPGDLLYFRGSDNSRTHGVGHVEMYISNGQCFGHGSGTGGTVKNLSSYCKYRQSLRSTTKLKNKGLICVIRFIQDTTIKNEIKEEDLPMTAEEKRAFDDLKKSVENLGKTIENLRKTYHSIDEVPDWGKSTVQKLMNSGAYTGTDADLGLSYDLLRTLVIIDRAGGFNIPEKVYHYTKELPDWYRPTIQKLLDKGIYKGASESDLNLTETMARILTINDRTGMYDK